MDVLRLVACAWWLGLGLPAVLAAQEWQSPRTRELVERATRSRLEAQGDSGLRRWQASASGTVLFLAQVGGDQSTPRLVKADQLAVEVYWEAPGRSKQVIVAWRDRAWLPTDLHYHRDHLGIVTSDFGPLIRIGEGDEVRDVPHPLSPAGLEAYEFGLADSISVASAGLELQVYAVQVRPRDSRRPAVLGTLYLERRTAAVVRFRFSFTPAAYLEAALEDITVVLENALHAGRYWLPWRQEIEIRRRAGLMDFPARGIIRGRWVLGEFGFNDDVPVRSTAGAPIGGLGTPGGPDPRWSGTLEEHLAEVIEPVDRLDFDRVRQEIRAAAGARLATVGPPARPAAGSTSDLLRVNRVEGLRLGLGATVGSRGGPWEVGSWAGYGVAAERWSGRIVARAGLGMRTDLWGGAELAVVDAGQSPVISPLLNSILSQELGVDRGDWVERRWVGAGLTFRSEDGLRLGIEAGVEGWGSRAVVARPAGGAYRPNPALGSRAGGVVRASVFRERSGGDAGLSWRITGEGGTRPARHARVHFSSRWASPLAGGELAILVEGGWASRGIPPSRGFVAGGWGTLPGVAYRELRGRYLGLARVEYLAAIRVPELALGSFAGTGNELRLGPFVALGAAGGALGGARGTSSGGLRPVAGIALEGLFRLIRVEVGVDLRGRRAGGSADVASPWWGIL